MNEPVSKLLRIKPQSPTVADKSVLIEEISDAEILDEKAFLRMLCLERKRTERSSRRFVLMLLESGSLLKTSKDGSLDKILNTLSQSTRETDVKGWYKDGSVIGVIFTELGDAEGKMVASALLTR